MGKFSPLLDMINFFKPKEDREGEREGCGERRRKTEDEEKEEKKQFNNRKKRDMLMAMKSQQHT